VSPLNTCATHFAKRLLTSPCAAGGRACAGPATAFNAPIAGLVFVLEELVERFDHRIAVATLDRCLS
jgi:H+/Cl- antiporter ClcA